MNKENSDTYSVTCRCPRLLVFVLAAALVFGAVCVGGVCGVDVWDGKSIDIDWAGSGTESNPYLISSAAELAGLSGMVNSGESYSGKYFRLTTDVSLNDDTTFSNFLAALEANSGTSSLERNLLSWVPIGTSSNSFKGIFDGAGHIVDNIYCKFDTNSRSYIGLFGCVASPGIISNLVLGDSYFYTKKDASVGSAVGLLKGGTIRDCSVIGKPFVGVGSQGNDKYYIGGLVGEVTTSSGAAISANQLGEYLKGSCTVVVFDTSYSKEQYVGLIVGKPQIQDNPGGSNPTTPPSEDPEDPEEPVVPEVPVYSYYNVSIYVMDTLGNYGVTQTTLMAGVSGLTASAAYSLEEGFSLDPQSVISGTISADNSLHLRVYLSRNQYALTIRSDGAVISTSNMYYGSTISLEAPTKPGFEFLRWNPDPPSTMPAHNVIIDAVWNIVSPIFTITIPDGLPLSNETYDGGMSISADIVQIPDSGTIVLTVRSLNDFRLVLSNHPDITLPYQLFIGGSETPVVQDGEVGRFTKAQSTEIPLNAKMTGTPQYSGSYADSLTFTVSYTET